MDKTIRFSIPFQRSSVNEERREVWGVASTEQLASDGRVLTYEASKAAFERWFPRGNVREMHQGIAAGRAIAWEADDISRSITVGTRVSKGAESTWQKILDGTLQAFSAKGTIQNTLIRTIQRGGRSVSVPHVTAYDITELSYVDSPSDPGAVFIDIIRADGLTDVLDEGAITSSFSVTDDQEVSRMDGEENITMAAAPGLDFSNLPETVLVDTDDLARLADATITPIADTETQLTGGLEGPSSVTVAASEGDLERVDAGAPASDGENAEQADGAVIERADGEGAAVTQGTLADQPSDEVTRAMDLGYAGGSDDMTADNNPDAIAAGEVAAEVTQVALAGQILGELNQLISMEAGEMGNGDDDECVWDIYGLIQARNIVKGFMVQEVVEAVLMARRAEEIDQSVTQCAEQLTEAITRLAAVEEAQAVIERGENPVITAMSEKIATLEEDLERYANQPLPNRPLARLPIDKMFPGDEQGVRSVDGGALQRALQTIIEQAPAGTREEAQALAAKVAMHEVYRQGPTPIRQ